MTVEQIYAQLQQHLKDNPGLTGRGDYGDAQYRWLARAHTLVAKVVRETEADQFQSSMDYLGLVANRQANVQVIMNIIYRTLARLEQSLPLQAQGAFINVGAGFSAFEAVTKVLASAKTTILIVDPYLSSVALFDFVPSAPLKLPVHLLSDGNNTNLHAPLKTGAERWKAQYGDERPLEVRITAPKQLHDRLIVIDDTDAWVLTQSLKDIASRSPASLTRSDAEVAALKAQAYRKLWDASPVL